MEGVNLKRLIDIVCYFNNVNKKKFNSLSCKLNVVDCRIVVTAILHNELKVSIDDISSSLSKCPNTILEYIEYNDDQYGVINHFTKLYDNTIAQYNKHKFDNFSRDVEEMILKTNYDIELERKLEKFVNQNTNLQHMLEREKLKNRLINKKSKHYV